MVAQLVELLICNQMVGGSSPLRSSVLVAYSVNVSDCESEEQGSIPANTLIVLWRNWIAHLTTNQEVEGSNPSRTTALWCNWQHV